MTLRKGIFTALAATAAGLAYYGGRKKDNPDLRGKIVLITGGSRGLGLALAREFGSHGASIAICARDRAELDRAQADLAARGIKSHIFVCDISDYEMVLAMTAEIARGMGPVDILINNAGVIRVGPFSEMDLADFDLAMNVMFRGALNTTFAVLPDMRARRQGNIVNITSVGGKVAVPHLLPYSCAKFATVALSEGLRTELAPEGIRVTTIVPGLMRTGSHLNAEFKGSYKGEYGWFAAGAATRLVSISAERAARSIVRATVRGESEKILSLPADFLARAHGLAPGLVGEILGLVNRLLPSGRGAGAARRGADIEPAFSSRLWKAATSAGRLAAESLNEVT